jgi:hypothetical protein
MPNGSVAAIALIFVVPTALTTTPAQWPQRCFLYVIASR